jgi:hypothetical protein
MPRKKANSEALQVFNMISPWGYFYGVQRRGRHALDGRYRTTRSILTDRGADGYAMGHEPWIDEIRVIGAAVVPGDAWRSAVDFGMLK